MPVSEKRGEQNKFLSESRAHPGFCSSAPTEVRPAGRCADVVVTKIINGPREDLSEVNLNLRTPGIS